MKRLLHYLNPIEHLGEKNYSLKLPFLVPLVAATILEIYANEIVNNPEVVGLYAIGVFIALIIYFSFRSGIKAGVTVTLVTIAYYAYIIVSRAAPPEEQLVQWLTVAVLGAIYLTLATLIGWLKETIDSLIDREANEKRRLQTIIQQLPVGVLIADEKGNVQDSNRQLESIFGRRTKKGERAGYYTHPQGTRNGKAVKPEDWPINLVLAGKKTIVGKDYTITNDKGKKLHVQISASAINDRRGKTIAAVSIITDTTSQKELESRKDDFVNMASHELKTPITSMKLYLESLERRTKETSDERVKKTIQSIKTQADRLQELVSDLLDVSRLQTGRLVFSKEKFNLNSLVEDTIEELQGATNDQNIHFHNSRPITVYADRFRIYQVISNLITNAVKYSPESTTITIRVKRQEQNALVSVTDQGIGVAKEEQKRIFDRLYQVTGSTEKTFPGLGMGLYISKEIVKKHGGKIWVESEKSKGSTFYFTLPQATKS